MRPIQFNVLIGLVMVLLAGCGAFSGNNEGLSIEMTKGKALQATAYSRFETGYNTPANQRWLIAEQNAKLSAYRSLAAMLYNEPLTGQKTVGSQVVRDEAYRIYVDAYLREARVVDYRTVKDSLKTTVELNLTPRFFQCISGDPSDASQCILEDKKLPITRIGSRSAVATSVNLSCGSSDCSDQYYVQGFSKDRNPVDNALLNAGFPDAEWAVNTATGLLGRAIFLKELIGGY